MKKLFPVVLAAAMGASALTACSSQTAETTAAETTAAETTAEETTAEETTAEETAAEETEAAAGAETEDGVIRVAGLKGPTTMGLVKLMDDAAAGNTQYKYDFTMVTAADEMTAMVANDQVDIALLPANVASVLYNKTEGGVTVIDINTLGVLYMVSGDTSLTSLDQLKGKTVYLTGKGATPEYSLRYLLSASGLSDEDVTLEFKSEAAEVAAVLAEDPTAVGMLPQPFVASALAQNDKLSIVMDMTKIWDEVSDGSRLVTGVTIVNSEFLAEHQEMVDAFLDEHDASIEFTSEDPDKAAELIAAAGIVAKAPIAKAALPYCNIDYIDGQEMKDALSGYLNVLFEQNPASVGGALPDDAFYYVK